MISFYVRSGERWGLLRTERSNLDGYASVEKAFVLPGAYSVKVAYEGDKLYREGSFVTDLVVEISYPTLFAFITICYVVAGSIVAFLIFRRKKEGLEKILG